MSKKEDDGWIYFDVKAASTRRPKVIPFAGKMEFEETDVEGSQDNEDWSPIVNIRGHKSLSGSFVNYVPFTKPYARRRPSKG